MSIVRQGWNNARTAATNARLVHTFLPEDPDLAHLALIYQLNRHASRHTGATEEYDHARIADISAKEGFSHHPVNGEGPSHGWMASYHAPEGSGIAQVHHISSINADDIAAHRQTVSHLMENGHSSKSRNYQGAWHDTSTGHVYLDVSQHFDHEHQAKDFAAQEKQKAVFHLGDFTERFMDPHQDPLREKDHDEWKNRYGGDTSPHPEYKKYSHLYPDTPEQAAARGQHKGSMAGRPVGPWRSNRWVEQQLHSY